MLSEYDAAVAAFIRSKGVTRCPTACLVPTQASVSPADRAKLRQSEAEREARRRARAAEKWRRVFGEGTITAI